MKRPILAMAVIAAVGLVASGAYANTVTVTLDSITGGPGAWVWNYVIAENASGEVAAGPAPGAVTPFPSDGGDVADYFTIYDFVGFTGAFTVPNADWTLITSNVGSTTNGLAGVVNDDANIVNLTFYYTGAAPLIGPFTLAGFSATSIYRGVDPNGRFSSEDTVVGGGNDGETSAAFGPLDVPAVPLPPAAALGLLGMGVLPLIRRKRDAKK